LLAPFLDTINNQGQHLRETILDQPAICIGFLAEVLDDTADGTVALSWVWGVFPRRRETPAAATPFPRRRETPTTETPSRSSTVTTKKHLPVPLDLVTERAFIVSPRDTASSPEGSGVGFVIAPSLVVKVPTNIGTASADAPPSLGRPLTLPTAFRCGRTGGGGGRRIRRPATVGRTTEDIAAEDARASVRPFSNLKNPLTLEMPGHRLAPAKHLTVIVIRKSIAPRPNPGVINPGSDPRVPTRLVAVRLAGLEAIPKLRVETPPLRFGLRPAPIMAPISLVITITAPPATKLEHA
jgi:hypothetical protein